MIVHGKGTGKLRQVIHAYLKDNSLIKDFRLGAPNEGGSGVTVVEL
ncbi:Endonuclease MutS2 [bioreactor metagenome]